MNALRRPMLLLLLLPRVVSAQELDCPSKTTLEGDRPPHVLKQWCEREDGMQHGPSTFWYPNGNKRVEAHFEDGELQGRYREWYEDEQLKKEGRYANDEQDGAFTSYHPNGRKSAVEHYRKGKLHGKTEAWWPKGQLMLTTTYSNGRRHGPTRSYFENGQLSAEGEFDQGLHHGTWRAWYEDGSKHKVAVFEEGREISREFFPREEGE